TDFGTSLASGPGGVLYMTGIFSDTCLFGSVPLISRGLTDIFVSKIGGTLDVGDAQSHGNESAFFYPNPAKDRLNIELISDKKGNDVNIELFSVLGVRAKTIVIPQVIEEKQIIQVQVNDLPRGAYMCRVSSGGNTSSRMIVTGD
ncbi:MAG: T9SS type A sorting domain-containing protein, partial [Candidatus Kapaibacterium sp.]